MPTKVCGEEQAGSGPSLKGKLIDVLWAEGEGWELRVKGHSQVFGLRRRAAGVALVGGTLNC